MTKQKADLRIMVRAANQYATVFYAKLQGHDLYCGPRLNVGQELFRHSYHESGKSHLRVPTPAGRAISEPGIPLAHIEGKQRIGASSPGLQMLKWGQQPKPDSAKRRTLIIDLETLEIPSWTIKLWVLEPDKPELAEEVFQFYEPGGVVLDHVSADWCTPNLLVVVWTLRPEAWAAFERSIQNQ